MARQSSGWNPFNQKRWLLMFLLLIFSISTVIQYYQGTDDIQIHLTAPTVNNQNPLEFMNSKLVLLVSHELSLSGTFILFSSRSEISDLVILIMPHTYVVHLGNSKELMDVAEDSVAKRVLREHVRETLGVQDEDILIAITKSVSRGKGQDLFLRSFHESLQMIQEKKLHVPMMHAAVVGSDMNAHTKLEMDLWKFIIEKGIQNGVHFVNKTLTVAPYLSAIDVLVQNSQGRGECFGRITIEAMAFQLPVLVTAAGGTTEIVVDRSTGLLHSVGKEGVTPLAKNIKSLTLGKNGYERVRSRFMERHMIERIASVLNGVLQKAKKDLPS
ncbi:hypothetical protein MKX01_023749 [Papaver californicum]|nr:hypothetical protein MKX01_023749 [Papaver californicum]